MLDRPGNGVVVRHHFEQQEAVAGLGGEDDTTHELVDPDGPDARVACLLQFFEMQTGVPVLLEFIEHFTDAPLDWFFQLGELHQEVLVDSQRRHQRPRSAVRQFS